MFLLNNKNCFPLELSMVSNDKPLNTICNILDCFSNSYCKYTNIRGKNKNRICGRRKYKDREYCYEHNYNVYKKSVKNVEQKQNISRKTLDKIIYEKKMENQIDVLPSNINNIFKKIRSNQLCNSDLKYKFNKEIIYIKKIMKTDYLRRMAMYIYFTINVDMFYLINFKIIFIFPKETYKIIEKFMTKNYNYEQNIENNKSIIRLISDKPHDEKYLNKIHLVNEKCEEINETIKNIDVKTSIKNKIQKKYKTNEQKRRKKELNKFNNKYKKLLEINNKYIKWANDNLSINFYIDKIMDIINTNMLYLDNNIEKKGKSMDTLRCTYSVIGHALYDSWEMETPNDIIEEKDLKLIYKQKWKDYFIYDQY